MNTWFNHHETYRRSTRNFSEADIHYVLLYGRKLYNAGVVMYFLGRRDIPEDHLRDQRTAQLVGAAVLIDAKSGAILTVYRNKLAHRKHRKKTKYRHRPSYPSSPSL
jgi:hypothetical protein